MNYRIDILKRAEKDILALSPNMRRRVAEKIYKFKENPFPAASKRLKGGLVGYRLRVGDWRVFYTVDEDSRTVVISAVKHRREAYR